MIQLYDTTVRQKRASRSEAEIPECCLLGFATGNPLIFVYTNVNLENPTK